MEAVVPWARLEALITPHYAKPRKGRPQMPLAVMLRIYFLQQWYDLSDPGAEEAFCDIHSMRDFAGLDLGQDAVPNETTILNFRHFLERHNLTETLFGAVSEYLFALVRRYNHGRDPDSLLRHVNMPCQAAVSDKRKRAAPSCAGQS